MRSNLYPVLAKFTQRSPVQVGRMMGEWQHWQQQQQQKQQRQNMSEEEISLFFIFCSSFMTLNGYENF